jgi:outer membrane receptor protein involved in Fe transport
MPASLHHRFARTAVAAAALAGAAAAIAQSGPIQTLQTVTVQGHYLNAVGSADTASQGSVTARLIENRPALRPAEVLEFVPGVIVTQHSGDGKANQYFLRGFNLDHGTDFATWVDGMPVNMPTHAHGHGYSDLNWLIPELVQRIDYRKGPYHAEDGDFSSAGAAHIRQFTELPAGIATATTGAHGLRRGLLARSVPLASGTLLAAIEGAHNDGPWDSPQKFHRANAVLRYSLGDAGERTTLTAMAYRAGWNATDQIPQRAAAAGLVGRFGTLDSSDGGQAARYALAWQSGGELADGRWDANAYAIRSRLNLYSNFTFFLDNPVDGDQFQQAEQRSVAGVAASRRWRSTLAGRDTTHTLGLQLRHDRLAPVGLYRTIERRRIATTQESRVRQSSVALHAESATGWTPWLRSVAGLRADHFRFDVQSSIAANSGAREASLLSPKLSLVFGPWRRTELFAAVGRGFHSNDARGTTARVTAKDPSVAAERVDPLVRSRGEELGLRTELVPGLQSSLALWRLRLASELLFVGDAGETEPQRASRRHGIEWNNHWVLRPGLLLDADLALTRSRFTGGDGGTQVPGSISRVVSLGLSATELGPWFGHLQLRHFGPRPLVEDNTQRSGSTTLVSLRAGYRVRPDVKLTLDVFNLFDRRASDIDYHYASRLPGEPAAGVEDRHFHPVEPRSVRLTLSAAF